MHIKIVGAGPAGAYFSTLAKDDFDVTLYDHGRKVGCRCAWGSYDNLLRPLLNRVGLELDDYILCRVERFILNGMEIEFDGEPIIVNRAKMLRDLRRDVKFVRERATLEKDGFDLVVNATSEPFGRHYHLPTVQTLVRRDGDSRTAYAYIHPKHVGYAWCLTPDNLIIIPSGAKFINEITVGEEVLTESGWFKVKNIHKRAYNGKIIKITTWLSNFPISLTPEHLVLTWIGKRRSDKEGKYLWKEAGSLKKGDFLVFPRNLQPIDNLNCLKLSDYYDGIVENGILYSKGRNQSGLTFKLGGRHKSHPLPDQIQLTEELMELFGIYLAEGWGSYIQVKDDRLARHFSNLVYDVFKLTTSEIDLDEDGIVVYISSYPIKNMLKSLFGSGACNKKIPSFFLSLPENLKFAFLKGYYLGDGSKEKGYSPTRYDHLSFGSISLKLAFGIRNMLLSLGFIPSIRKKRYKGTLPSGGYKEGDIYIVMVSGKQLERIPFEKFNLSKHDRHKYVLRDNYMLLPIRKIEMENYNGIVYDLTTNGSFCTSSAVVHNCFPVDEKGRTWHVGAGCYDIQPTELLWMAEEFYRFWLEGKSLCCCEKDLHIVDPNDVALMKDGVVSIGEAAGCVFGLTGEGNVPAMETAAMLYESIEEGSIEGYVSKVKEYFDVNDYCKAYDLLTEMIHGNRTLAWIKSFRILKRRWKDRLKPRLGLWKRWQLVLRSLFFL